MTTQAHLYKPGDLLLLAASAPPMTAAQQFEQKVSWCFGMQGKDGTLTKDQVREILRRQMGKE